jgi:hypothetical protein
MKRLYHSLLPFILLLTLCSPVFSQYNVIGIDFPHGITGKFKPSFERSIGKHFSALINYESGIYATGTTGNLSSQTEVYRLTGKGWMPGVRYYPFVKKKTAPLGFSLGLYYRRMNFEESYTGEIRSNNPFTPPNTQTVNINSKAKSSNYGFTMAYKFNAGPVIIEPLVGFGSIN